RDIHPADIVAYLPCVGLADIIDGGADFHLRLLGTRLDEVYGGPYTGRLASSLPDAVRSALFAAFLQPTRDRSPYISRGSLPSRPEDIRFKTVTMPLADDGETPNMLLFCSHFDPLPPVSSFLS